MKRFASNQTRGQHSRSSAASRGNRRVCCPTADASTVLMRELRQMPDITLTVDPRVYRLSAVKKAGYHVADRCFVQIDVLEEGSIQVRLMAKSEGAALSTLEGVFRNEL